MRNKKQYKIVPSTDLEINRNASKIDENSQKFGEIENGFMNISTFLCIYLNKVRKVVGGFRKVVGGFRKVAQKIFN